MPKREWKRENIWRDRFREKFEIGAEDECWPWLAGYGSEGYGSFGLFGLSKSNSIGAHRAAWIYWFGQIPNGMWVLHRCDNRACVNPNHLFLGTLADNNADRCRKGRYVCAERHFNSRITNEQAVEIRQLSSQGWSQRKLAAKYGLSQPAVGRVVRGLSYREALDAQT